MEWQDVPVYIINRNNLDRGFRDLVNWLVTAGTRYIEVLDNGSSYPRLMDYYHNECPAKVNNLGGNFGPYVFWERKLHLKTETPYIVTDADVVPDKDCPLDLIPKLMEVFGRYDNCKKVGPGLRIDNLPDHYKKKEQVIGHESQFSSSPMPQGDVYAAAIDTTFALYWTQSEPGCWVNQYRLAAPYVAEHRPWYVDSDNLTGEDIFYVQNCEGNWSYWKR